MAPSIAGRLSAALIVLLLTAPIGLSQIDVPEHFLVHDNTPGCFPVLDNPVSGKNALAWLNDPRLNYEDLDNDGHENLFEVQEGSDPTKTASTPLDRDGDGSNRSGVNADECDFDPRVPALVDLVLSCVPECADNVTTRNTVLVIDVTTKGKITHEAADPDGPVECRIEHLAFQDTKKLLGVTEPGTEPTFNRTVELDDVGVGLFRLHVPLLVGDFAGHWFVKCSTTISGAEYSSVERQMDVEAVTFGLVVDLDRDVHFEGDAVFIAAYPKPGAYDPRNGSAEYEVTGKNDEDLNSGDLEWDDAVPNPYTGGPGAWVGSFDPDQITDGGFDAPLLQQQPRLVSDDLEGLLFDGLWTITVDAEDAGPGEPNEATNSSQTNVTSVLVDELELSSNATALQTMPVLVGSFHPLYTNETALPFVENAVAHRRDTLRFTVDYLHRAVPVTTATIQVRLSYVEDNQWLVHEPGLNMTPDPALFGRYHLDYHIDIANATGHLQATARLISNGSGTMIVPVESAFVQVDIQADDVALHVATDRPVYASSAPVAVPVSGFAERATINVTTAGETLLQCIPANVGADLVANCGPSGAQEALDILGPLPPQFDGPAPAETVLITARPLGAQGTDFVDNDTVDLQPPGRAFVSVYVQGAAPVPHDDHLPYEEAAEPLDRNEIGAPAIDGAGPVLDRPMTWTCVTGESCRFEYPHVLGATDAPGQWRVVVRYRDDAHANNTGENAATYMVRAPADLNYPPQVEITQINDVPVAQAGQSPPVVTNQSWFVEGTYLFTNDPFAPPMNVLDTNQVWVRVASGDNQRWVRATLRPDGEGQGFSGNWSVHLNVQRTYGLNTSGVRDIQAVSLINPVTAANCEPGGSAGSVERNACNAVGPNGAGGPQLMGLPVTTIYSQVDHAEADFHYPGDVQTVLLGVIGPDGNLLGTGDVLWDGTTHTLSGRAFLNNNTTTVNQARVNIERVAYDNCRDSNGDIEVDGVSQLNDNDYDEEWCRRERVSAYDDGADGITRGYDLVKDPLGRGDNNTVGDQFFFNFTWDIRDSKAWVNNTLPDPCEGNRGGGPDYLVHTNETLVRRSNSAYNLSDNGNPANKWPARVMNLGNGSVAANPCHWLYEQLEDQGWGPGEQFMPAWLKSDFNQTVNKGRGMYGQLSYIEDARYWVWLTVETGGGFWFNQTKPETAEDVQERRGSLAEQVQTDDPAPSLIANATGIIPGFEARQVRFGASPNFTIDTITQQSKHGDVLIARPGDKGFQLLGGEATFTGTILNNNNSMSDTDLLIQFYMVEYDDCVTDGDDDNTAAHFDLFVKDSDGEWCVLYNETLTLQPSNFTAGTYDTSATAGVQPFSFQWTPPLLHPSQVTPNALPNETLEAQEPTNVWFMTVSFKTEDGDRIESLPPVNDVRPTVGKWHDMPRHSLEPVELDLETYDFLRAAEYLCPGVACSQNKIDVNPVNVNLTRIGGLLGSSYAGVSLTRGKPTVNITEMGPFYAARPMQNASFGTPCVYETYEPSRDLSCSFRATHQPSTGVRTFFGVLSGDTLTVDFNVTDFGSLQDLKDLRLDIRSVGYALITNTPTEHGSSKVTLATVTVDANLTVTNTTDPKLTVQRFMTRPEGAAHDYLEYALVHMEVDISGVLETYFNAIENQARVVRPLNSEVDFVRTEIEVRLANELGSTARELVHAQVDRISPANVSFLQVHQTVWNATTNTTETTSFTPISDQTTMLGRVTVPVYEISGNSLLDFNVSYPQGVSLGSLQPGVGKLAAVDASQGLLGPPMEWFVGGDYGRSPLESVATPAGPVGYQHPFVFDESTPVVGPLIFPMDVCTSTSPEVDPGDMEEGSKCSNNGIGNGPENGARIEGVTVYYLPIRVGLDPMFVRVEMRDPWDPTTWKIEPNPGDRTYAADLSASGVIVDPKGAGWGMDGPTQAFNNYTALNFFYVGSDGTIDPEDPSNTNASAGSDANGRVAVPGGADPNPHDQPGHTTQDKAQPEWLPFWIGAGVDKTWPERCQDGTGSPGPGTAEQCLGGGPVWTPIGNVTQDNIVCSLGAGGAAIDQCFGPDDQSEWFDCVQQSNPLIPRTNECDPVHQEDEILRQAQVLVNRNLPLWIHGKIFETSAETRHACSSPVEDSTGCASSNQEAPSDPDADRKDRANQTIPRGFLWEHYAGAPELVETGGNYSIARLDRFSQVFETLDAGNLSFGKLNIRDGRYVVSVKGVDNTESFSALQPSDFPGVANDACCWTDVVVEIENDEDDDGISDIREKWLKSRIISGWMRAEIDTQLTDGSFADKDRYWDNLTVFPLVDNADSNEEDWDGDGVPNSLRVDRPNVPAAVLDLLGLVPVDLPDVTPYIIIDLERMLNTDPLVRDHGADVEPGKCDRFGFSPLGFDPGRGLVGDRDNDCLFNVIDTNKWITRCPDQDSDGFCDDEEEDAGSNPDDPQSTPSDVDGDGIPNNIDTIIGFITSVLPGTPCAAALGQPCEHDHWASLTLNTNGIGHLYLDQDNATPPGFAVGYSYLGTKPEDCTERVEGHCEVIGNATLEDARKEISALVDDQVCLPAVLAPGGFKAACAHGHNATFEVNQGGVGHIYVDADDRDPLNFSVGFSYSGTQPAQCNEVEAGHCEIVGNATLQEGLALAADIVDQRICAPAVVPALGRTCEHGHWATANISVAHVGHLYIDLIGGPAANSTAFEVGYSYTGSAVPVGCTVAAPGHCRLARTTSLDEALLMFADADNDGYTNQQELTTSCSTSPLATPNCYEVWSNPFYRYSTPDKPNTPEDENGYGFIADYDADRDRNEWEATKSDPTQRCSTRAHPNGWSPINPRPACE